MKIKKLLFVIIMALLGGFNSTIAGTEKAAESSSLFKLYDGASQIDVSKDINNAVFLQLNFNEAEHIFNTRPSVLNLSLPVNSTTNITLQLHSKKILTDNFVLSTDKSDGLKYIPGVYYQGTVAGKAKSMAAVSVFDKDVITVFSYGGENYVLGLWDDKTNINKDIYILYKDNDAKFAKEFKCAVKQAPQKKSGGVDSNPDQVQNTNCIKIYFECDYQMFLDKGSVINVSNYVTGMFNVVQQIFNNEQISTEISQIYVWTATDPYVSNSTSSDYLNDFQATRTTFNGNLAHLLTTRSLGIGGVAYVDVICTPASAYGFSEISNTYQPYPNYSNTILIVTHELGHNFGSNHTHWCGWPGGPIDNCVPVDDGPCTAGPSVAPNGGTIMSYCHLNVGTSLSNGFGPLPGNHIRSRYAAATCLTSCNSAPDAQFSASAVAGCTLPQTITFTDQSTFGTNAWQWDFDNDGIIDDTTQNPSYTYTVAGSYSVKLIASNTNGSDTILKTGLISVGTVPASISIAITSGTNAFCQNTSVTFTATPVNGGNNPEYQWYIDGSPVSNETNATFTTNTLSGNPVITCGLISSASCANPNSATSSGITITVTPNVTPTISIATSSGSSSICAGESVTFLSSITNGGSNPVYDWKVGSTSVGSGTSYTSTALTDGDAVTCTITSDATCASPTTITSTDITIFVEQMVTPTASIALTSGVLPTCPGSAVSFTASSGNGGLNPSYQWKINGANTFVGTNYTPVNPADGDVVTCVVTSDAQCLNQTTASSNGITINLISPVVPGITISLVSSSTTQICEDDSTTTFTAIPNNAGTTPTYQWLLNGFVVNGALSQTYHPPFITDGDIYSCEITSSETCPQTVESNSITLTLIPLPSIAFVSDLDVCAGNIPQTVFSSNPAGASYIWTNSNTAIGLPASGTQNVPAFTASNTGSTPITATITVTPVNQGCDGPQASYTITINPTPEITVSGATLTSSSAAGYQWYLDGTPIMGATSQTYIATENGEYSVIVDGNDCPSASVTVTTASIGDLSSEYNFNVYPNPNDGNFFIALNSSQRNTYTLRVINALGALVYEKQLTDFAGQYTQPMALTDISKGVYIVSLLAPQGEQIKKVIVY